MITSQARRRIATGHAQAEKRARTPANEALRAAYKKPHKFKAKPRRVDGIYFASELEVKRYGELKLLERAKQIETLRVHPVFHLVVNGRHICDYVADFSFTKIVEGYDTTERYALVEDTKGVMTADCRLKLKLMKAIHGIDVQLIKRAR